MAQGKSTTGFSIDEKSLKEFLDTKVKEAVKEVIEAVLEAEAEELAQARPYERTTDRKDRRNGKRKRQLTTRVGKIELEVPRLRMIPFQSQIIDRYRRMESSLEEALIEMYLQGVSTRRVTDITEQLCDASISGSSMSRLNNKVYDKIDAWRSRQLEDNYDYLYVDGMSLKARVGDHVETLWLLVVVGVNQLGYREVLGVEAGVVEDEMSWLRLFRQLRRRGVKNLRLVVSDAHEGIRRALRQAYPKAQWQRCYFHFMRNVLTKVPRRHQHKVAAAMRAVYAQEDVEEAVKKADRFVQRFEKNFPDAVRIFVNGLMDTLTYYEFPETHWRSIRTNNPLERLLREVRRRLRVASVFPNAQSALVLASARLKWVQDTKWAEKPYLNMKALKEAA